MYTCTYLEELVERPRLQAGGGGGDECVGVGGHGRVVLLHARQQPRDLADLARLRRRRCVICGGVGGVVCVLCEGGRGEGECVVVFLVCVCEGEGEKRVSIHHHMSPLSP